MFATARWIAPYPARMELESWGDYIWQELCLLLESPWQRLHKGCLSASPLHEKARAVRRTRRSATRYFLTGRAR